MTEHFVYGSILFCGMAMGWALRHIQQEAINARRDTSQSSGIPVETTVSADPEMLRRVYRERGYIVIARHKKALPLVPGQIVDNILVAMERNERLSGQMRVLERTNRGNFNEQQTMCGIPEFWDRGYVFWKLVEPGGEV